MWWHGLGRDTWRYTWRYTWRLLCQSQLVFAHLQVAELLLFFEAAGHAHPVRMHARVQKSRVMRYVSICTHVLFPVIIELKDVFIQRHLFVFFANHVPF